MNEDRHPRGSRPRGAFPPEPSSGRPPLDVSAASRETPAGREPDREALHEALNTLQRLLEKRGPERAAEPAMDWLETGSETAQESEIPLLEEVAVPQPEDTGGDTDAQGGTAPLAVPDDEDMQHLIARLAGEIEVIVENGIEEALREATGRITERVKTHIEIMLPEILEEIEELQRGGRQRRP